MGSRIEENEIIDLLKAAKSQFVDIAISNRAGEWSQQYYAISEVKDIYKGESGITLAVLTSLQDSQTLAIDTNMIGGIRFNKYLNLNGFLTEEVKVDSNEE